MSFKISTSNMVSMLSMGVFVSGLLLSANTTADMSPEVKAKVEQYKKHITEWAANPVVVNAVKEANAKGPIAGMANSKWDELGDKDEIVTGMQNSPTGQYTKKLEEDKNVNKITVWDEKGNMIASSTKALIYNAASRAAFTGAMKGKAWSAPVVKPDTTTQKNSVNISDPVMDGGKVKLPPAKPVAYWVSASKALVKP